MRSTNTPGRRRLVAIVVLAALSCIAPAVASAAVVDTLFRDTQVSVYGRVAVWSAYDDARAGYQLKAWVDGQVVTLDAAPRTAAFDVDVGPDADGRPTVVYSRCAQERREPADFSTGRGCSLRSLTLPDGHEQPLAVAVPKGFSAFRPALWRGRLAFAADRDRGGRSQRVYVRDLATRVQRRVRTLASEPGMASLSALDLRGRTIAYHWSGIPSPRCSPSDRAGKVQERSEVGIVVDLERRDVVARACDGGTFEFSNPSLTAAGLTYRDEQAPHDPVLRRLSRTGRQQAALPGGASRVSIDGVMATVTFSPDDLRYRVAILDVPRFAKRR